MEKSQLIIQRTKQLAKDCDSLVFDFDGYIYNPLIYAWNAHEEYLKKYVGHKVKVLFLGMNPGPFGMMQTGIPFGEIGAVKNYLKICSEVGIPSRQHPNRPVVGMNVTRSEISGKRLWGLFSQRFPDPFSFFKDHAVFNYCPLGFLLNTKTAKNETPDHLQKDERKALESICDTYLTDVIEILEPDFLIGVGKYAQEKLQKVSEGQVVTSIIHPSPGNPMANNGWAEKTTSKMKELGLWN